MMAIHLGEDERDYINGYEFKDTIPKQTYPNGNLVFQEELPLLISIVIGNIRDIAKDGSFTRLLTVLTSMKRRRKEPSPSIMAIEIKT